ncbi:MAG: SBBP repeat-containing protein, partial [Thermoplasmata archaeon]|nr:SBBP repeat-containing protein [Thermoplasmata archaeon]
MKKHISIIITFMLIISGLTLIMEPVTSNNLKSNTKSEVIESEVSNIFENLNKIDGYFTENRGQINENAVKYYIQGKGAWFLDDGVVFEIREKINVESQESEDSFHVNYHEFENANLNPMKSVILKLNFEEANEVIPKGQRLLPHESNFFYGNESSKWYTNVPNYQEIIYENLYNNIDLRYYSSDKGLKYDFIIHPNGDPSDIVMSYEGAQELYIDSIGNLRIQTPFGDIVDSELFIYQNINNIKNKIEGKFILLGSKIYGFKLMTEYDLEKELVIDPLVYSTLVGSIGDDWGYSIKADSSGNAYITGCTDASDFPYTPGAYDNTWRGIYDVFMFKLNLDGSTLIYSTFIGGSNSEFGQDIVIDTGGNAYITGFTNSNDFPCTL